MSSRGQLFKAAKSCEGIANKSRSLLHWIGSPGRNYFLRHEPFANQDPVSATYFSFSAIVRCRSRLGKVFPAHLLKFWIVASRGVSLEQRNRILVRFDLDLVVALVEVLTVLRLQVIEHFLMFGV